MNKINRLGQRFGKLVVIEEVGVVNKSGKKRISWLCKCDCGNTKVFIGTNLLKNSDTKSCGCDSYSWRYNFVDLVGQKFGDLEVIELCSEKTKTRGSLWLCKCVCGNTTKLASNCLTSGNNKTCGNKTNHPKISKYCGEIPIPHITNTKQNAIKRNLQFSVTPEFLWNLFLAQNRKCALSGVDLFFTKAKNACTGRTKETNASLDRIDSIQGYIEGNVQWVHKDINRMKWHNSDEEFLAWCQKVVNWKTKND